MTSHQLRHTYATALVNAGVSLQALMALLGHVSAEMSLRYGRLFDTTVRTEYERALTLAKQRLGTLPEGRTTLPLAGITSGADWKTPPSSSPGWPAGSACAPPRRAPAPTPTSASTARTSAPTPPTCPSWPPSAPTPSARRRRRRPRLDHRSRPPPRAPRPPRHPHQQGTSRMTSPSTIGRAEQACSQLAATASPSPSPPSQPRTGIGRATLYRDPALRALIDDHRHHTAAANTLTGLTDDIHTLRTALDAIAARVRHHEEQLRRLTRNN